MATRTRAPAKKKQQAPTETSASIDALTKAFLEQGGVIEKVATGVSGQDQSVGRKQIHLGNTSKSS